MTLSILEALQKIIDGTITAEEMSHSRMNYPPPISQLLEMKLVAVGEATATMEMTPDPARLANPMGTIHGGVLCDLADAAIGTAHATTLQEGESFTSVDLKINFFRPQWDARIRAEAKVVHLGKTTSYYECRIIRDDGKLVAAVASTVMTLRGEKAAGR